MPLPRTFARVRSFDIACPDCGTVSSHTATMDCAIRERQRVQKTNRRVRSRRGEWDPRHGRWRCRCCYHVFFIGVAIWRGASRGQVAQPPGDTIPSYAESQILRGLALDARVGTGGRARANYVIDGDVDADPPRIHPRRTVEGDAFDLDIETDLAAEDEEKDKVDKL